MLTWSLSTRYHDSDKTEYKAKGVFPLSLSRPKAEAKGKERKLYFTSSLLIHARSQDWMIPLKPYNISMHEQKRISRRTGVRREEREEEKEERENSLSHSLTRFALSRFFSHTHARSPILSIFLYERSPL
jgi:hypothetical protein